MLVSDCVSGWKPRKKTTSQNGIPNEHSLSAGYYLMVHLS